MIEIILICDRPVQSQSVELMIDNVPQLISIHANEIHLDYPTQFGLHTLTIQSLEDQQFAIHDVWIAGDNLDKMLYLSWLIDQNGQRHQPCTGFWAKDQTWYLPFGSPLSFWTELVSKKLGEGYYGKDLEKYFQISWPDTHVLQGAWPQIIKDFFATNFDFFCAPRNQDSSVRPWLPAQIEPDPHLLDQVLKEIDSRRDEMIANRMLHTKQECVCRYDTRINSWWFYQIRIQNFDLEDLAARWPCIFDLVESLCIKNIHSIMIGFLPAGSYLLPHIDEISNNIAKLYIPLRWHAGNLFKFSGSPIIRGTQPILVNTNHVHALVNDSEHERIVLAVKADRVTNLHLYRQIGSSGSQSTTVDNIDSAELAICQTNTSDSIYAGNMNLENQNKRKTQDSQIWIAGCSYADGAFLPAKTEQRYGQLVADYFGIPASFLAESGSSISYACDQILCSDIKKNDILIWALTGIHRFCWFIDDDWVPVTYSFTREFKGPDKKLLENILANDAAVNFAQRYVAQVKNVCDLIGVELIIMQHQELSARDAHEKLKSWLLRYQNNFLDIDMLPLTDTADDQKHPGPDTHKRWANAIIKKIEQNQSNRNRKTLL